MSAALVQPCLGSLPWHSVLPGRRQDCSVRPSVPHSPLLCLPWPSALPSFGTDGACGCGPLAAILMREGQDCRAG